MTLRYSKVSNRVFVAFPSIFFSCRLAVVSLLVVSARLWRRAYLCDGADEKCIHARLIQWLSPAVAESEILESN